MAGRGSGWHNESRRHSLARRGVRTVIDDRRRLPVSRYVARGNLEGIDSDMNVSLERLDPVITSFSRYRDEWVDAVYDFLAEMGYDDEVIEKLDRDQVEAWASLLLIDYLADELSIDMGNGWELSDLLQSEIGIDVNTDDLMELIYNSVPLLDMEFSKVIDLKSGLEADTKQSLYHSGLYTADEIDDAMIGDWASMRIIDYVEDGLGIQKLSPGVGTLEDWMEDKV